MAGALEGLRERESLRGLCLIVDSRRGLKQEDIALIEWADPSRRHVHVLLAKADKLNQAERAALLRETQEALGDAATVQVFAAHTGLGVKEAQRALTDMLDPKG